MVKSRSNIAEFSSDLRKDALYMMEKVEDKELPETLKEIYTFRKNDFLTQILVE